jgi:hypothetical protein
VDLSYPRLRRVLHLKTAARLLTILA